MKLTDVIRRPLITEKTTHAARRQPDGGVRGGARAPTRSRSSGRSRSCSAPRSPTSARDDPRQGEAPGPFRRPPVGLEEGVRQAPRGREDARLPGRRVRGRIMPIRKYKPTSPGRRQTVLVFDEITTDKPHKPLTEPLQQLGRPQQPRRADDRGGAAAGTSASTAIIDFKRDKDGIPAKVSTIEYDPNRSARIALLDLRRRREALHPAAGRAEGRRLGRRGRRRRHPAGQLRCR